jgi:hypothetical protein
LQWISQYENRKDLNTMAMVYRTLLVSKRGKSSSQLLYGHVIDWELIPTLDYRISSWRTENIKRDIEVHFTDLDDLQAISGMLRTGELKSKRSVIPS